MDSLASFWQRAQFTILTFASVSILAGAFTYLQHRQRKLQQKMLAKVESASNGKPPEPEPVPFTAKYHSKPHADEFRWLHDPESPKALEYLHEENAYTAYFINTKLKYLQQQLYNEFLSRSTDDKGVQEKRGEYIYYDRSEPGKQYGIVCRRKGSVEAPEEILLDQNELAEGKSYFSLGVYRVSPDNTLLAYSVDFVGNERYVVKFRDLTTGEELPDQINDQHVSLEWANDSKTVFFDRVDNALRPFMIVAYTLGSKKERVVFMEKDPKFHVGVKKRHRFILIETGSIMTNETWIVDADQPSLSPRVFQPRQFDVLYMVEYHDHGSHFFVLCNVDRHRNFTMYTTPITDTYRENWVEFLPYDPSVSLEGMVCFRSHVVIYGRADFKPYIRVVRLNQREEDTEDLVGRSHFVTFVDPCYNCAIDPETQNLQSNILRLTFSSLTVPATTYDYNMDTRELIEVKRTPVLNYNPDNYRSEMIYTRATDGTRVAISLVYKRGLQKNSQNPCLMYGYGAYGSLSTSTICFSSERVSLLDRGFVYAIAHVRGSGDNGKIWYEEGKLMKKRNSFSDFIKCAEKLIRDGYTSEEYLALYGRSAGGLLVAAVLNSRPDLFKAALIGVPFVDCINTLMDSTYPLTVNEYEEWGNPNNREVFEYISTYSPYDNIRPNTQYPNILVFGGFHDARVRYWEPAKYVAKLRYNGADGSFDQNCDEEQRSNLLLRISFDAGHFGSAGRFDSFSERSIDYAFLVYHLMPSEIPTSKVHLIFDVGCEPPHPVASQLEAAITRAGYVCQSYFVTPDDIEEKTEHIPDDEIVFLHCDMPSDSPPGSTHDVARSVENRFRCVSGASAEFVENTTWRSLQNRCLALENIPHLRCVRIEDTSEIAHKMQSIEELGTPITVTADSVLKFREEAIAIVADSVSEALRRVPDMLRWYGPIVFQRHVVGREFTVACTHENRVYSPCEKFDADDENSTITSSDTIATNDTSLDDRKTLTSSAPPVIVTHANTANATSSKHEDVSSTATPPSTSPNTSTAVAHLAAANATHRPGSGNGTLTERRLSTTPSSRAITSQEREISSHHERRARLVDVSTEAELVLRLQKLAVSAYRAVKGSGFGRVEIIQDGKTGELFVVDIVPMCSIADTGYFQTSTNPTGGVKAIFQSLLQEAANK